MATKTGWLSGFCTPGNPNDSHLRCNVTFRNGSRPDAVCTCECHQRILEGSTLVEVVYTAVGAASVCWENFYRRDEQGNLVETNAGVFQDDRARKIADEVIAFVEAHYTPRNQGDTVPG